MLQLAENGSKATENSDMISISVKILNGNKVLNSIIRMRYIIIIIVSAENINEKLIKGKVISFRIPKTVSYDVTTNFFLS